MAGGCSNARDPVRCRGMFGSTDTASPDALRWCARGVLLFLALAPCSGGAAPFVEPLAPGVYLHIGKHHPVQSPHRHDIANIGFVIGARCIAVIDTGGSADLGKRLLAAIRQVSTLPICYVINTHVHFDHVLGNAAFTDTTAQFAGHVQLAGAFRGSLEFFREEFTAELGDAQLIKPELLVEDKLQLDLGNRILILQAWAPAHTDHDLTVLDLHTRTLWTGDLLFRERLPIIDSSLRGWLGVMESLGTLDAQRVIPGHGTVSEQGWQAASADQSRYLSMLLRETRQQIAIGTFLGEAAAVIGQAERDRWELFDAVHPTNVNRSYRELEWE